MANKANYRVDHITDDHVDIVDMGPWDKYQSVTNAAESVVSELRSFLAGRRLFYYDSDGDYSELLITSDGEFNGYAPAEKPKH